MKKINIPKSKYSYLAKGKRSQVYTAYIKNKKVAIKVYKSSRDLKGLSKKEAINLIMLNKKGMGPKILYYNKEKIIYNFIEGKKILDYIKGAKPDAIKKAILKCLDICFRLDTLKINKKEMGHPVKHILVGDKGNVNFIDFERAYKTNKPKNTSQFYNFLLSKNTREILSKKGIKINPSLVFIKTYKSNQNAKTYKNLIKNLFIDE